MSDLIERFRDYQIEWLTTHNDIELKPELEKLIVQFLKDTAEQFDLEQPELCNGDLIWRNDAIDALAYFDQKSPTGRTAQQVVMGLPSAQPEPKWIPVSERPPKVAHSVLFSRRSMDTREGCLQADGKWWQYRWNEILNANQVTAWMLLPEPYREDGGE